MGKLIEWYVPVPKAVLTLATEVEKPVAAPEVDDSARLILTGLLEHADTIEDIVVLTRDAEGVPAFLSNLDGFAETMLFIDLVRMKAMQKYSEDPGDILA